MQDRGRTRCCARAVARRAGYGGTAVVAAARRAARSGSITAYWPQWRNSGQPTQSCAIFSGTQMCGTIEKPRRTKCDGSCVKAQSVANPLAARRRPERRRSAPARAAGRGSLVDDQRADLGDLAAERRELGAADQRVVLDWRRRSGSACAARSSSVRGSRWPSSRLAAISAWMASACAGCHAGSYPVRQFRTGDIDWGEDGPRHDPCTAVRPASSTRQRLVDLRSR